MQKSKSIYKIWCSNMNGFNKTIMKELSCLSIEKNNMNEVMKGGLKTVEVKCQLPDIYKILFRSRLIDSLKLKPSKDIHFCALFVYR
jgi:hypothetical protein